MILFTHKSTHTHTHTHKLVLRLWNQEPVGSSSSSSRGSRAGSSTGAPAAHHLHHHQHHHHQHHDNHSHTHADGHKRSEGEGGVGETDGAAVAVEITPPTLSPATTGDGSGEVTTAATDTDGNAADDDDDGAAVGGGADDEVIDLEVVAQHFPHLPIHFVLQCERKFVDADVDGSGVSGTPREAGWWGGE